MHKKISAILFGALVIMLITTSSGFSQKKPVVSGQITKSTGGSNWVKPWNRYAQDYYGGHPRRVPFSATGYYSNLECTRCSWNPAKGYGVLAFATDYNNVSWRGLTRFTSPTTTIVNVVLKKVRSPWKTEAIK